MRAAFFVFSQPMAPRLPLPSRSKTTSSFLAQRVSAGFGLSSTQACLLHGRWVNLARLLVLGHWPRPIAGLSTWRLRVCRPPPQLREHADHRLQADKEQSSSQACTLQLCVSVVSPHSLPWYLGRSRIFRIRSWTPPPHCALQA
eukprot:CAMPEP_0172735018 /NCGR_PEP_ID=MMETSP1074-20121228/111393_1 /TAXON_ID=2916 /ORGANISM="Ceratium fusus, Strain PA161109" /LENGTH=143 /DNA_ID=CAMNT_0013563925 /DNA_START=532 /DNA_END=959 /DNA_ORIENTATION=-